MEYEMNQTNETRAVFQQQQLPYDANNNNGSCSENPLLSATGSSNTNEGFQRKKKITDFFHVSRKFQKPQKPAKVDYLFIGAENVTAEALMESGGRALINVNDQEIALVAHNNVVYAIEPKCPHVGGPIHHGDIEDVPGCGPCIKCPWHSWTFSLKSGRCIAPHNRETVQNLKTFPVQLSSPRSEIKIGFTEISPKTFNSLPE